jgi:plasmid stabilization system protein ParE
MSLYVLTPHARSDIFGIWCYIARNSEDAADRVERSIYDACALVAENPAFGHKRLDLTRRPLLFWTVSRFPNYVLAYRPETTPIQIVAVLHGRRHIQRILKQRQ